MLTLAICSIGLYGQNEYDPATPPNPQATEKVYPLYCEVVPNGTGYVNMPSGKYTEGSTISVSAYNYNNFRFVCWMQDNDTISTESSFTFTMPAREVRYVAVFAYDPTSPANPDAPVIDPNHGGDDEPVTPPDTDKEYDPANPANPGTNKFDPQTGIVIIDDFKAGGLRNAINQAIAGYTSADIRQIIVQGTINSNDFSAASDYSNCSCIDFSRCSALTTVPTYAYYGNTTLEQIILPSSLEKIGAHAFENATKLTEITCYATTPPIVDSNAFSSLPKSAIAYVPEKSMSTYRSAEGWKDLTTKEARNLYAVDFTVSDVTFGNSILSPKGEVTLNWKVNNEGSSDSNAGWKEAIYLSNGKETSPLLYTVYYNNILEAGKSINRSVTFKLPEMIGVSGYVNAKVVVMPSANAGESVQAQANNAYISLQTANLDKLLYISSASSSIVEGTSGIAVTLKRSGSCSQAENISLKASTDNLVNMRESVCFNAGENSVYFIVSVPDNNEVNALDSIIIIASSDEYETVKLPIAFEDNDKYPLTISLDKKIYAEGETIHATISVAKAVEEDLPITLNIEHTKRFRMPSCVVIKKGSKSVTVDIPVLNDDIPSNDIDVEIKASNEKYDVASTLFILADDDVPAIDMTLTPSTISEGAGTDAVYAIITRKDVVDNKINLRLTDDGNGDIFYNSNITMEKGVTEINIPISIKDNVKAEGQRDVHITASIYISTCDCNAEGTKQSVVTKTITIIDNDGPTISLSSNKAVIMEGDTEGATFTVSRNNSIADALPVQLTVDAEDIVMPAQVTIPPGMESTTFTLYAKRNKTQEGNRVVNVKAMCDGYSMGAAYILVSDQTLPDMSIENISITPKTVEVNQVYNVDIKVKNVGAVEVPARSTVTIKTDNDELTLTIPSAIPVGGEKTVSAELTAPSMSTTCKVTATSNANKAFTELQTINNSASSYIEVISPFTMTISTDKTAYNIGDVVRLTGKISSKSQSVANVKVEPYVTYFGARIALEAVTSADGSFSLDYTLPEGIGGDFEFGACLPGEYSAESVSKASVYGMARTSSSYYKLHIYKDEPYKLHASIKNLSSLALTDIKATVEDLSNHYNVKVKSLNRIDGKSQAELDVEICSNTLSTDRAWERIMITLTSAEGAKMTFPVYCYCVSHNAVLNLSTSNINTTITKDTPRLIPVTITNTGMGTSGKITVDIPENQKFLSLASSVNVQNLTKGDSATIMLKFNPEGLDVNVIQKGSIAINCENADGTLVTYQMKVVSEDKGSLSVRVMDENTEFGTADGKHPYVSDATVTVKDYNSGVTLYSATSDADGYARFDNINEGAYTLYVTASKHDSYIQNVMVNPGEITEHMAFVSYQAISVSFNVEEIALEDKYKITSEFSYETMVPVPVVEMDSPKEIELQKVLDGGTLLYNVTLTNKGLINAENVNLSLPEYDGVDFIALNEYSGLTLKPGQVYTIPVYVSLAGNTPSRLAPLRKSVRAKAPSKPKCSDKTYLDWEWVCTGNKKADLIAKVVHFMLGTCDPDPYNPSPDTNNDDDVVVKDPVNDDPLDVPDEIEHRVSIQNQVDLYRMYQYACKLSCALQCFPITPKDAAKTIKNPTKLLKCIVANASRNYAKGRKNANAQNSLYDNYKEKFDLILALDSLTEALDAEIINAPELRADTATYNKVKSAIDKINENINVLYSEGKLYSLTTGQLYEQNIDYMPQRMADWYDFNLSTYIERQVSTFRRADGLSVSNSNYINADLVAELKSKIENSENKIHEMGFVDVDDLLESAYKDAEVLAELSKNTCATVKFSIDQQMVLTRQAFRGTMIIENSSNTKLTNVSAVITATNEEGIQATAHEMQLSLENTSGFIDNVDGTWTLEPGTVGVATYIFIPSKYAAPTIAQTYKFGGSLYFNDGDNEQVRSLYPCSLVVNPTPELDLTYFMQRDLYGDNPLTEDVKEPIIPAEFTVLIKNKGKGDAQNVRMITHQPEIVENQKGLLVDFAIVSSSLNGENKTMALSTDIATNFGTIPAGSCSYATWDLTSTLLGHIKDYNVSYTHLTNYGNPDLSLLDNVTIHELIHSINTKIGDKVYRAWVTNDEADSYDLPDHIYFSNGSDEFVHPMPDAAKIEILSDKQCKITVDAVTQEWIYTNVENPMNDSLAISKITNANTGEELDAKNFWTTQYTMIDGKDSVEEHKLHIVDFASGTGEISYIIDFDSISIVTDIQTVSQLGLVNVQGIYTTTGVKVAANTNTETLRNLPKGIYIINRRKYLKR